MDVVFPACTLNLAPASWIVTSQATYSLAAA